MADLQDNVVAGNDHTGERIMNDGNHIGLIAGRNSALASMAVGWVMAMAVLALCVMV
jgi:hypothetical protein